MKVGTPSITNPSGTNQTFTTFLLRGQYNFTPKLSGTVALYDNLYQDTFPYALSGTANADGTGFRSRQLQLALRQRFALEYRPTSAIAVRASAGSAIAPPYLSLLSKLTMPPSTCSASCAYSAKIIRTSFRRRLSVTTSAPTSACRTTTASSRVDGYLTDLYNHFLAETVAGGTCAAITYPGLPACPVGVNGAVPDIRLAEHQPQQLAFRRHRAFVRRSRRSAWLRTFPEQSSTHMRTICRKASIARALPPGTLHAGELQRKPAHHRGRKLHRQRVANNA